MNVEEKKNLRLLGRRAFIGTGLSVGVGLGVRATQGKGITNQGAIAMNVNNKRDNSSERFYRSANDAYTIVDSMKDSLRFTTRRCLTTYNGNLCANSSFVDPIGEPQPWHPFGELEGVGWAANAVGGAYELLCAARVLGDERPARDWNLRSLSCFGGGIFR